MASLILPGLRSDVGATESGMSSFRLSGYGTLGYTVDDRSDMVPIRDFSQKPEDGHQTDSTTWKLDSRIGLQAYYRHSHQLEFLCQGVFRDQVEKNFNNALEMAYTRYTPSPELEFRGGRLGYDAFLMSDVRNIGYANLWVRPPTEFYAWIPIYSVDGVDAVYRLETPGSTWRFKIQAGQSRTDLPMGDSTYDLETEDLFSFTVSRQWGAFFLKAGYSQFTLENEAGVLAPLHSGLDAVAAATAGTYPDVSAEAGWLRYHTSFKNNTVRYLTIGAGYDDGTWTAQAEISHNASDTNIMPHGNMGYISIGRRFKDLTPYVMFSMIRPTYDITSADTDWGVIGQEALQNQSVYLVNSMRSDQETYSAGIRWDFHNQAAVKLQWDHSRVKPFYGLWYRELSTVAHTSHINLLTFCLEFVF